MIAEHLLLVDVGLHLDDGTGGVRVRSDDRVTLACDTEGALHLDKYVDGEKRAKMVDELVI